MKRKNLKGFTLIELLIVIAIIAIVAGIVFVALDPLTRLRNARDSRRYADISSVLNAVKINQVDNGGSYLAAIAASSTGLAYMIGTAASCDPTNCYAATGYKPTSTMACLNLSGLVTGGYLGSLPINPTGTTTWASTMTGYTFVRATSGIITISSCEAENVTAIQSAR